MEVVTSLSQGRTAAAQCGLFKYKSVPVIFELLCIISSYVSKLREHSLVQQRFMGAFNCYYNALLRRLTLSLKILLVVQQIINPQNLEHFIAAVSVVSNHYNNQSLPNTKGVRGGVVVKALSYKPIGGGFNSRWCHWNFLVT